MARTGLGSLAVMLLAACAQPSSGTMETDSGAVAPTDQGADLPAIVDVATPSDDGAFPVDRTSVRDVPPTPDSTTAGDQGSAVDVDDVDVVATVDGAFDAGLDLGSPTDTVPFDIGSIDTGPIDTGPIDTGPIDTGPIDVGFPDAGSPDTGTADAGPLGTCPAGMRYIPAGQFQMGELLDEHYLARPVHGVRLSGFCMDQTEVNVSAYRACYEARGCSGPSNVSDRCVTLTALLSGPFPVNCVTWQQARTFCQWRGADLPTEAQWEYAARGSDGRPYPWGTAAPGAQACRTEPGALVSRRTCAVGSYPAGDSPFGISDMAGNVEEWVRDWRGGYTGDPGSYFLDPTGPADGTWRVVRGGSVFYRDDLPLRSTVRNSAPPTATVADRGFRCSRPPVDPPPTDAGIPDASAPDAGVAMGCPGGMRPVPAGQFQMGDPMTDDRHAQPVHGVRLRSYCMDEREVSVTSYRACVAAGRCTAPAIDSYCNWDVSGREGHPVNCVNWEQSRSYCQWRGGDLPTEAQWEYAARGTDGRTFPWGNAAPGSQLCWNRNAAMGLTTCVTGSFPSGASPFGLLDMAGNVFEWTLDWDGDYAGDSTTYLDDPTGPASGTNRVVRGGGWQPDDARVFRAAYRLASRPAAAEWTQGFRCVHGML